ncbi:MAG: hypothetical protein NZ840_05055 [Anaerolineales bacterium]|nr:hypothetical protein [Anaerolineales bacterium]MDW8161405.1 hypothetical protein [Anaerolineales bacterium]
MSTAVVQVIAAQFGQDSGTSLPPPILAAAASFFVFSGSLPESNSNLFVRNRHFSTL